MDKRRFNLLISAKCRGSVVLIMKEVAIRTATGKGYLGSRISSEIISGIDGSHVANVWFPFN